MRGKISDFGLSKEFDFFASQTAQVGTWLYMAPEVIRGDFYSLSCTCVPLFFIFASLIRGDFYSLYTPPLLLLFIWGFFFDERYTNTEKK